MNGQPDHPPTMKNYVLLMALSCLVGSFVVVAIPSSTDQSRTQAWTTIGLVIGLIIPSPITK